MKTQIFIFSSVKKPLARGEFTKFCERLILSPDISHDASLCRGHQLLVYNIGTGILEYTQNILVSNIQAYKHATKLMFYKLK